MKAVVAYIVSCLCWHLGDRISVAMNRWEIAGHLYPAYNRLMSWSFDVEAWAGVEYWWGMNWATPDDD